MTQDLIGIVELVLRNNHFKFDGQTYQQISRGTIYS